MSSARMPPKPHGRAKLQPVQPLLLVRAQVGMHAGGLGTSGKGLAPWASAPWPEAAPCHTTPRPGRHWGVQPRQAQAGLRKSPGAVAHQLQQGGHHPRPQRLGGQAHKAAGIATRHVGDKRRQLRLPGGGIGQVLRVAWAIRSARAHHCGAGRPVPRPVRAKTRARYLCTSSGNHFDCHRAPHPVQRRWWLWFFDRIFCPGFAARTTWLLRQRHHQVLRHIYRICRPGLGHAKPCLITPHRPTAIRLSQGERSPAG